MARATVARMDARVHACDVTVHLDRRGEDGLQGTKVVSLDTRQEHDAIVAHICAVFGVANGAGRLEYKRERHSVADARRLDGAKEVVLVVDGDAGGGDGGATGDGGPGPGGEAGPGD